MRLAGVVYAVAATAAAGTAWVAYSAELALDVEDFVAPSFSARGVSGRLSGKDFRELALDVKQLRVGGRDWRNVKLTCADFATKANRVTCSQGVLDADQKIPVSFSYALDKREFVVELKPAKDETWRASGTLGAKDVTADVTFDKLRLDRFVSFLPKDLPKLSSGRANGTVQVRGAELKTRLEVQGLAFADAQGLHAGDKIVAKIDVDAVSKLDVWTWTARLDWQSGEVFWTPYFVTGHGQRLTASGSTSRARTDVRSGSLDLPQIGAVKFSASWDHV